MTKPDDAPSRRRAIVALLLGLVALVGVFVVGAAVSVPTLEHRLRGDVEQRLSAEGITADVVMSGQTATLRCATPLADPAAATHAVSAVKGVHSVQLDQSCGTASFTTTTTTPTTTATTVTTTPTTTPTTTSSVAPSTSSTAVSTPVSTTAPAVRPVVSVRLVDGRLLLSGKVASKQQRDTFAFYVGHAVAAGNLVVAIVVDPSASVTDDQLSRLATAAVAMPVNLVSGTVGIEGERLHATGLFADDPHRAAFERVVAAAGVESELLLRPAASSAAAARVQTDMNALVAANPIVYKKGAVTIAPESQPVIERLAGIAKRFGGMAIEVQGHTDSEGDAGRNLLLSQRRAQAAVDAMVARGVPVGDLTAKGFGETQLIRDQTGKEIPAQSRRVVFGVKLR